MRRPTKSGSNGENKTNFGKFSTQSMNLDTYLTKISEKIEFDEILPKKGVIR